MTFLANSRLRDGVTRQQVVDYMSEHGIQHSTWDLFRHRTVERYHFKVGDQPGAVLFLDVETEEEARKLVTDLPIVAAGLLEFEIDPLSQLAKF
jgi:hypothetical protein